MNISSIARTGFAVALWAAMAPALGHQATELYIPLGQSPGISGKVTDIGAIDSVDPQSRTITVGGREVAVARGTRVYLDRSALAQKNAMGSFTDLRPGRQVEIRYLDDAAKRTARWVKVRVEP